MRAPKQELRRDPRDHPHQLLHDPARQLITGASSGIGAAAALSLAAAGHTVVLVTELPTHITHEETRPGVGQLDDQSEVTPEDVAEVIAFVVTRPRRLAIHELLLRPAGQP